jgi:uncharacterized membrane protein YqgA involved in biofilm formation
MDAIIHFPYTGVIVNVVLVVLGSLIGLLCKKGFPQKLSDAVMFGAGLCTAYIGISGAISAGSAPDANPITPVVAIAGGALIGTLLDIDGALNRAAANIENKLRRGNTSQGSLAEGFVSATLLFCVGSMIILGGLSAGISGDNTIYFTKSVIDFAAAVALSVSLGAGVMLSAVSVGLLQGLFVLAAGFLQPILTQHMIGEINCVGNLLIVIIGLNLMGITKQKVANFLPAIVLALIMAIFI